VLRAIPLREGTVARAQAGDRDALRVLYLRHSEAVYRYVRTIVRDDHEAEDVTQQVFAKLLTALPAYEPQSAPFSAWLRRVAHNVAIDHLRRRRATPSDEVPLVEVSLDDTGYHCATSLRLALDTLPRQQRDVLLLRHLVGLLPSEIAELLGKSVGAVHALHHRARVTARMALVDLDAAPATLARSSGGRHDA
jgi:RNA polymerase sigma-70 factor, ECF subfamily